MHKLHKRLKDAHRMTTYDYRRFGIPSGRSLTGATARAHMRRSVSPEKVVKFLPPPKSSGPTAPVAKARAPARGVIPAVQNAPRIVGAKRRKAG